MNLKELGFSVEDSERYKQLVSMKMESFRFQSEDTGGEIEYKGYPFYPEFAKADISGSICFTSADEIDEFIALQDKMTDALLVG